MLFEGSACWIPTGVLQAIALWPVVAQMSITRAPQHCLLAGTLLINLVERVAGQSCSRAFLFSGVAQR